MKKSDLKTGMLTEDRHGNIGMVINEHIVYGSGFNYIKELKDNMTMSGDSRSFDIMKVSNILDRSDLSPDAWNKETINKNIFWDREDTKAILKLDGVEYSRETLRSIIKKATS